MAIMNTALSSGRPVAAGFVALAASMVISTVDAFETQPGEATVTCSNVTSGASWQIHINYDNRTVDSNPARISGAQISWHDAADGGNYTLERASGNLTVVVASSTGGYFLHHHCKLEN